VRLLQAQRASADNKYHSLVPETMAQRPPASLARVDAASAKHIGGQFESHIIAVKKDHITESDADLQHASTNRNHESLHSLKKPANNASRWAIVDRQPMITEKSAPSHTVHHSGHTNSSSMSTQGAMIPLQRWHLEAAKVQPWNGLRQVSKESNTTTEALYTVKKSKASSMETRKESTSQASFNDSGRRNGCT
jgi:hypothetical protein